MFRVHCPQCLVLSGVSYKKRWCDCWRNVEGGDLGKKSAGAGRVRGWVGFISNSRYHLHHQPPHCPISSQIMKTWASRHLNHPLFIISSEQTPGSVSCISTYKRKISGKHRFLRPVGREPRAGETMKIVFWFNLALHGIQLGRNKAHLLMFSQLYFSFHFNPTYFK